MAMKVTKVKVWAASIEDRPGGLAAKLDALAEAGANLEVVIARRAPDKPGTGVVFVTPVAGARQTKAARAAGFATTDSLHSLRVEGPDQTGIGARITRQLADARINLRGLSAAAIGRKFVCYLAFDGAADAARAAKAVKGL
jgi:hypothetical protein